jgi:hypothetical protein
MPGLRRQAPFGPVHQLSASASWRRSLRAALEMPDLKSWRARRNWNIMHPRTWAGHSPIRLSSKSMGSSADLNRAKFQMTPLKEFWQHWNSLPKMVTPRQRISFARQLTFKRPNYAGNAIQAVQSTEAKRGDHGAHRFLHRRRWRWRWIGRH